MDKRQLQMLCNALLLFTALIWGVAFVAQSVAMDSVGPWAFIFFRFLIGSVVLLPVTILSRRVFSASVPDFSERKAEQDKASFAGGIICGFFLGLASAAQQIGIISTSVGKAGFITALYVVLVPLLGWVLGKKPRKRIFFCALLGLAGLYLISMQAGSGFWIEKGDAMLILSALLFAFQITSIDFFSEKANPIQLSNLEFFTASMLGLLGMIFFERDTFFPSVLKAAVPILYAGVLSSGVAYTLQVVAQKYTDPTIASLLMSMESVFSALAGWLILGQILSMRELAGCGIVFLAVVLAQLPDKADRI